jgi:hypothetical protein
MSVRRSEAKAEARCGDRSIGRNTDPGYRDSALKKRTIAHPIYTQ